jgi:hypothetical protein
MLLVAFSEGVDYFFFLNKERILIIAAEILGRLTKMATLALSTVAIAAKSLAVSFIMIKKPNVPRKGHIPVTPPTDGLSIAFALMGFVINYLPAILVSSIAPILLA